jgi:YVTN family beta-propeller protein
MNMKVYLFLAIGLIALAGLSHAASFFVINTINGTNPAFAPSGKIAYTINTLLNTLNQSSINIVNVTTNEIIGTILIPPFNDSITPYFNIRFPQSITFSPDGKIAYVVTLTHQMMGGGYYTIAVINVSTGKIIANISGLTYNQVDAERSTSSVIFSHSDSTAYFIPTLTTDQNVYVINVSTNSVIKGITLPSSAFGIALNSSGALLYASNIRNSSLSVINTITNSIVTNILVGSSPTSIAINPSGTLGYVTNSGNNTVSVFSTTTNKVIKTITAGPSPDYVVFNLNGSLAFVADSGSTNVSVINVSSNTVIANINLGTSPQTEAFNPNPNIPFLYVGDSNGNTSVVTQIQGSGGGGGGGGGGSTTTTTSTTTTSTTTSTTSVPSTTTITYISLPRYVLPSSSRGNTKVEVSGTGFTPYVHVNFGYSSDFPPNTNAIAATYANSNGSWIMNFSAPWNVGDYTMTAIDSRGVSATATLNVVSHYPPFITFSFNGKPSNSSGNNKVLVSGYNFTPNTLVNLGYFANFPPYTNAIFATTTNSTGFWTGSFSAPWNTGSYKMLAIDSHGINATNILYVGVASTTTTTVPTTTTIPASSCSGTPNLIIGPNPAPPSDEVSAGVTGLSNCNGYTVTIKDYLGCTSGATIASFTSNSTGGLVNFEDPSADGQYGYYACVNGQSSSEYVLTVAPFTGTTVSTTSTTIASTTTIP